MSGVATRELSTVDRRRSLAAPRVAEIPEEHAATERAHAARFPVSRWYLLPALRRVVELLAPTSLRPTHVTWLGAAIATATIVWLTMHPGLCVWGACGVWLTWCCDRIDGMLARRQGAATAWGAWLDANLDELVDVTMHAAVTFVAATQLDAPWPWYVFAAFVAGKYLWLFGLTGTSAPTAVFTAPDLATTWSSRGRRVARLSGDADVRIHVLIVALLTGLVIWELALTAAMFNLRWLGRFVGQARRLRETRR